VHARISRLPTTSYQTHGSDELAVSKVKLTPVFTEALVPLTVPADALNGPDGVYFVAFIEGLGVEDRVYETKLIAPGACVRDQNGLALVVCLFVCLFVYVGVCLCVVVGLGLFVCLCLCVYVWWMFLGSVRLAFGLFVSVCLSVVVVHTPQPT